jgi:hypothetical protein
MISLIFFIVSCNSKNETKVASSRFVENETNKELIDKQPSSDILKVSIKMQKQEKLTKSDYDCICNYLLNDNDESESEGIGYSLFEYLKGNYSNNNNFISYLNEKEVSYKEKVQSALVEIMCIDIGYENYSYDAFIKNFGVFKNSDSAKKTFKECMSNQ